MTNSPDPWPAIDGLANLINDLADQVQAHARQLQQRSQATSKHHGSGALKNVDPEVLRVWVEALVTEYGLHAQIGAPARWEAIPPLRAELIGLMMADVRQLDLEQGSFELVYWHDALARVLGRVSEHADRWQQDQQNQQLLGAHR